eukprot:m.334121 g.334121  ORF g.334121 m.334121 type:complete len:765 (+) comp17294_c0_seq1:90-2384(+)
MTRIAAAVVAACLLGLANASIQTVNITGSKVCGHFIEGFGEPLCHIRYKTFGALAGESYEEKGSLPLYDANLDNRAYKEIKRFSTPGSCNDACLIAKYKRPLCERDEFGGVIQITNVSKCPNDKYPGDETCCIPATTTLNQVGHQGDCAKFCEEDSRCQGFSNYWGNCVLFNTPKEVLMGTSALDQNVRDFNAKWITMFKESDPCEFYNSAEKPCVTEDGYRNDLVASEDFTDLTGWSTLMSTAEGVNWLGSAPVAFDSSSPGVTSDGLKLPAKYDPTFNYPQPESQCGCGYSEYTSGMIASDDWHSYGFYEANIKQTASKFANAFWLQGPTTEVNIIQVNPTGAFVSAFCFDEAGTTFSFENEVTFQDGDVASVRYTENKLEWFINGAKVQSVDTPDCLKGPEMRLLFSVEGTSATSSYSDESGTDPVELGAMIVTRFRKWSTLFVTSEMSLNGEYRCDYDVTSDSTYTTHYDTVMKLKKGVYKIDEANVASLSGVYEGPSAGPDYHQGRCGIRFFTQRFVIGTTAGPKFKYVQSIRECGDECNLINGCNGFYAQLKELNAGLRFKCTFFGWYGNAKNSLTISNSLYFERKVAKPRACTTDSPDGFHGPDCDYSVKNNNEKFECFATEPFTIDGTTYPALGPNYVNSANDFKVTADGKWKFAAPKNPNFDGRQGWPLKDVTLEHCAEVTKELHRQMKASFEAFIATIPAYNGVPMDPVVGCNSFAYSVRSKTCVSTTHTTSSKATGQIQPDFYWYLRDQLTKQ